RGPPPPLQDHRRRAGGARRAAEDDEASGRHRPAPPSRRGGDLVRARSGRLALALYPLAYRRRYGDEMAALVEDSGPSSAAVLDLLRGAARAHLHPEPAVAAEVAPDERRRLGLAAVLL